MDYYIKATLPAGNEERYGPFRSVDIDGLHVVLTFADDSVGVAASYDGGSEVWRFRPTATKDGAGEAVAHFGVLAEA